MKKILPILFLFALFSGNLAGAEKDSGNRVPDFAIGINGNYGLFDMSHRNMEFSNENGLYSGGGITIEKMTGDNTGFGSGIQYRRFNASFTWVDSTLGTPFKVVCKLQSVNIPFFMILSLGGEYFAVNFEGGAVYSHIVKTRMKAHTALPLDRDKDNALKYIETNQFGLTAGILFKVRVTEYTDFMIGVTGEYYPTNLLIKHEDSNQKLNMYNYSVTAGYMFRTNVFSRTAE